MVTGLSIRENLIKKRKFSTFLITPSRKESARIFFFSQTKHLVDHKHGLLLGELLRIWGRRVRTNNHILRPAYRSLSIRERNAVLLLPTAGCGCGVLCVVVCLRASCGSTCCQGYCLSSSCSTSCTSTTATD